MRRRERREGREREGEGEREVGGGEDIIHVLHNNIRISYILYMYHTIYTCTQYMYIHVCNIILPTVYTYTIMYYTSNHTVYMYIHAHVHAYVCIQQCSVVRIL